jgi:hypothetical protein
LSAGTAADQTASHKLADLRWPARNEPRAAQSDDRQERRDRRNGDLARVGPAGVAVVAERKSVKAVIEGLEVIPDSFDYAPTGQTVAGMWSGDDTVKRNMVKAVKNSWGLGLAEHEGQWGITIGADFRDVSSADGIADLGNGLCFRRDTR